MNRGTVRKQLTALLTAYALLLFAGCKSPASLPATWRMPAQDSVGELLSKRVVLVADNQLHHLYGQPVWIRSGLTNRVVSVAIRPVQLDLWGPDLLEHLLETYTRKNLAIHLGDALDVGCSVEWDQFVAIMSNAGRGWVMAPGNHDFNYVGNGHFSLDQWQRACATADGSGTPLTKDRFVVEYLRAVSAQGHLGFPAPADASLESGEHVWTSPNDSTVLQSVAWRIDADRPWRSYVAQQVNIGLPGQPPVVIILVDTNQYHFRPRLIPIPPLLRNAGVTGELQEDQIDVVDAWLGAQAPGQVTMIMGHHPYKGLARGSRSTLERWRQAGTSLYVSAHTHTAQFFVHEAGDDSWLELNLGSTTDWPPEVRTLSVSTDRVFGGHSFRLERKRVDERFRSLSVCKPEWEIMPGTDAYYLAYGELTTPSPTKTTIDLMNTLLSSYEWLLKFVRSAQDNPIWPAGASSDSDVRTRIAALRSDDVGLGDKLAYLRKLSAFERERVAADAAVQKDFRMCQALWASNYDKKGARVPDTDDSYVLIPTE